MVTLATFVNESSFLSLIVSASSGSETNGLAEETAASGDYVLSSEPNGPYLAGPMVIRVYPDGRPVPEDQKRPLPRDEDIDELRYSRLPSIEEIEAKSGSKFYGKGANEPPIKRRMSFVSDKDYRLTESMRLHPLIAYDRMLRAIKERGVRYYWREREGEKRDLSYFFHLLRDLPMKRFRYIATWRNGRLLKKKNFHLRSCGEMSPRQIIVLILR